MGLVMERAITEVRSAPFATCLFDLLINQDCLLPWAWCFVGAVNAAGPTARAPLALQQFVTGSLNAPLARFWLLRVIDPTDKFIPTKWC
tara:strand:+ start:777 stop:1043 length:267 start_codon:yes stop_codon:yes gene_type:complete